MRTIAIILATAVLVAVAAPAGDGLAQQAPQVPQYTQFPPAPSPLPVQSVPAGQPAPLPPPLPGTAPAPQQIAVPQGQPVPQTPAVAQPPAAPLQVPQVQQVAPAPPQPAQPSDAGEVAGFEGQAGILRQNNPVQIVTGARVLTGDVLGTGERSKLVVLMRDGSMLILGANARLVVEKAVVAGGQRQSLIRLISGKVRAMVTKVLTPGSTFDLVTPTSVAGVRGTVLAAEVVEPKLSRVYVLSGVVAVRNVAVPTGEVLLGDSQFSEIAEGQPPKPSLPIPQDLLNLLLEETSTRMLGVATVRGLPGVKRFTSPLPVPALPPGPVPQAAAEAPPEKQEEGKPREAIDDQTGFATAPFGPWSMPGRGPFDDLAQSKGTQDVPVNVKVDTFRY